jgi:predicted amidohydrolase
VTHATLLQVPARFGEPEAQLGWVLEQARAPTDLLLLPETAFTGYVSPRGSFDLTPFAEPLERGVQRLANVAKHWQCDVVGPVIERVGALVFNATLGVSAEGEVWLQYRKRHPWLPETWASPGDLPWPLVQRFGRLLTCAVCFDLHFLPAEAAQVLEAADTLLFPSAWVDERLGDEHRAQLLQALADRFSLTILNSNWGPGAPRVPGQGGSMALRHGQKAERIQSTQARLEVEF